MGSHHRYLITVEKVTVHVYYLLPGCKTDVLLSERLASLGIK